MDGVAVGERAISLLHDGETIRGTERLCDVVVGQDERHSRSFRSIAVGSSASGCPDRCPLAVVGIGGVRDHHRDPIARGAKRRTICLLMERPAAQRYSETKTAGIQVGNLPDSVGAAWSGEAAVVRRNQSAANAGIRRLFLKISQPSPQMNQTVLAVGEGECCVYPARTVPIDQVAPCRSGPFRLSHLYI